MGPLLVTHLIAHPSLFILLALGLAGCGGAAGAAATAPRAQPLRGDARPDRCSEASRTALAEARADHFNGPEAFDSFGCNGPRVGP